MLTVLISSLISISIVVVFRFISKPHKPPLFGIYQQRNKTYWFKFAFLLVGLYARQWYWRLKRQYLVETGKSGDGTICVHEDDIALENKYDQGTHSQAVDSVFFNGVAEDGNAAVVFMLARRPANYCDAYVSIKLNGEEYLSPKLPDTYLEQGENEHGEYKVQGIHIENFIPMRTWKLSYNGEMKLKENSEKVVKVQAELTWSALFAPFHYQYQMSPRGAACDLAREPWSMDYFRLMEKLSVTYYEQMGSIKGTVKLDGKENELKMPAFRDHMFGNILEWRNIHRYAFHTLYLDNGDCIAVGFLSQPLVMSHVTMGHVCRKSDPITAPVQSSDFKMYQHGENHSPPTNYGFTLKADGKRYTVQVSVDSENISYVGARRVGKLHDRWVSVDVNGVRGRGFSQWHYNTQASNKLLKCE